MSKIDLTLMSGITASDGSYVDDGAVMKFDSEFIAGTTNIRIIPKLYRNRELFENGFDSIQIPENTIPCDFIITLPENEYYQITPYQLYVMVGEYLNVLMGGRYFELKIIED